MTETDLTLSTMLSPELGDEYQSALDFIQLDAGASLIKFRIITEMLVTLTAVSSKLEFETTDLNTRINELLSAQVIHSALQDQLHQVRKLGNQGAHPPSLRLQGDAESQKNAVKAMKAKETERLKAAAEKARLLTVENMKDLYSVIAKEALNAEISIVTLPDRSWEGILTKAVQSSDYKDALKAGQTYESLAVELRQSDPFNETLEFDSRYRHFYMQAALQYQLAITLSASLTENELYAAIYEPGVNFESIYAVKSNVECLYKYWSIAHQDEYFGKEVAKSSGWALEAAVKRGHLEAIACLGGKLIHESKHEEALPLLLKAAESNIDVALCELSQHYRAQGEIEKALYYVNRGAKEGGSNCIAALGIWHHEGKIVEQSNIKAEELLIKAMQIGSVHAEGYYFTDFLKKRTTFEKRKSESEKSIKSMTDFAKTILDIGTKEMKKNTKRNDPCTCGSGVKFKKCCLRYI